MGKIERYDEPGVWHHVMNRGLAHRTVIENRADARMFLAFVARAVARGQMQVHAYCLMTTHFHMLVRSSSERLSLAMQLVQQAYVRWFNRTRDRDGPLFRGRFRSRRIRSEAHWVNVIRYIDANATEARIVHESEQYPYCSRFHYSRQHGPAWLSRAEIEAEVCRRQEAPAYSPELYEEAFARTEHVPEVAVRRMGKARLAQDEFDDLISRTSQDMQQWMRETAVFADGTLPGSPVTSPAAVMSLVDELELSRAGWRLRSRTQLRRAWPVARAGLLRIAAGLRHREIAGLLDCSVSAAGRMLEQHRQWLASNDEYCATVATAVRTVHFGRSRAKSVLGR